MFVIRIGGGTNIISQDNYYLDYANMSLKGKAANIIIPNNLQNTVAIDFLFSVIDNSLKTKP